MKISFKDSADKTQTDIFLNDVYLGAVRLDVWSQKWTMHPAFSMPYHHRSVSKNKYDSAYEAGKEMVELYNFLFPPYEDETTQEFGINLEEMLSFLKIGK